MKMKKFLNSPENLTDELLEGLAGTYPDKIRLEEGRIVVRAVPKSRDKVAVITMGGSGHEPALSGFVGEGMLDASVAGDIFAAPNAVAVLAALRKFKDYAGILLVVLNHAGDVMSANMALKIADWAYVMQTGSILMQGPGEELAANEEVKAAYLGTAK